MNCLTCCEWLALYVDGSLNEKEMQEIKAHLKHCLACAKEAEEYSQTLDLVCRIKPVDTPVDFHQRFWCRFNNECKPFVFQGWWSMGMLGTVATAAAGLLIVILFQSDIKMSLSRPQPTIASVSANHFPEKPMLVTEKSVTRNILSERVNHQTAATAANSAASTILMTPPFQSMIAPAAVGAIPNQFKSQAGYPVTAFDSEIKTMASERLYRQEKEWTGNNCTLTKPATYTLRSRKEAQQLWKTANIQSLPIPEINWNQAMLGAVFLGTKTNSGYELHIDEIQNTTAAILIKYRVIQSDAPGNQKTQPFLVFLMPASGKTVVYTQQ